MSKAPSVLICGSIRDGHAFAHELETYFRWRAEGAIDRIVFSGWLSNRLDGNIGLMERNGVEIILAHEPVVRGPGHIFHQLKNLDLGLQAFDDDELVLRCRTDKTSPVYSISELARRFHAAELPGADSPFRRRLMLRGALPLQPFFFNDMAFMGLAGDIKRLVSFDIWWEIKHALLNPEQIFHLPPYEASATRVFSLVNPGLEHSDVGLSIEIYRFLLTQELYLRAVAEGLSALEAGYVLGWDEDKTLAPPAASDISGLLDLPLQDGGATLWMQVGSNIPALDHSGVVTLMLDMPISRDDTRTLRSLYHRPGSQTGADLDALAAQLVEAFKEKFPGRLNSPTYPYQDGALRIFPPRTQSLSVA